jgi:hypothetical protein
MSNSAVSLVSIELILKLFQRVTFLDDVIVHKCSNLKINYNPHKMSPDTIASQCSLFTFQWW